MKVQTIDLNKIEQNENSRVVYKQVDLAELMMSMKKNGLLEPIGVRAIGGGKYEAVFGNRRILSAKKLGWTEIPAHILEVDTDVDRDIIGLIENLKRQNTSVAEDGRMFQSLRDRGLSVAEIAARLDIKEERVRLALEVVGGAVPEEYKSKIVYAKGGPKSAKGKVTASTAHAILSLRRREGLNRKQTREIFKFAADTSAPVEQISKIAPLVKSGVTIAEAIERVSDLERVVLTVFMHQKDIDALETKHKKRINQVLTEVLAEKFKLVDPEPKIRGLRQHVREKMRAIAKEA